MKVTKTFTLDVPVAKTLKEEEENQSRAVNDILKEHYDI